VSTETPRELRRRQHRELSRNHILDAAEDVFARKGFHDATVKEIAQTAEFSVGGVYSFFDEKDDLFVGIFERRGGEFMDGMREVLARSGEPRERMHRLADFQVQFFRDHPSFGVLFLRSSGITVGDLDSKITRVSVDNYTEAMTLQAKLFRDGQEAGELRDGDAEVLAMLFSGIVSSFQASDPLVVGNGAEERMTVAELHEVLDGAFSA
jgi:AcrR family transcriptional regulator